MYNIPGLTSSKVQKFINGICSHANSYLEIGSYLGATSVAALDGNNLNAYFVDRWDQPIQTARDDLGELPENNKETFISNVKRHKGNNTINIFESDLFDVDISEMKDIEVFFYDGPHDFETTSKAVQYYASTFAKEAILIFDDANFDGVVYGARDGLDKAGLLITYDKIILTSEMENVKELWNGLYIVIIE
jgi:predicted O-methyltransferase YrrM